MLDPNLLEQLNQSNLEIDHSNFYDVEPLACDFETTGLKKSPNNALALAFVIGDRSVAPTARPSLKLLFLHTPEHVQDVALAMNARLFVARALAKKIKLEQLADLVPAETLTEGKKIFETYTAVEDWDAARPIIDDFLNKWYGANTPTLLGKNVQNFDRGFFPEDINLYFAEESIDVGDFWRKEGEKKNVNTQECCRRAGISDKVTHDAYEDDLQALQLWELGVDKRSSTNT